MSGLHIFIDGKRAKAWAGASVLEAALAAGIYIPHLCHWRYDSGTRCVPARTAGGSCRLCFIEVEGQGKPVCACEQKVFCGMRVSTQGHCACCLAIAAFELLMAEHTVSCATCLRNIGSEPCEFKVIARWLGVPLKSRWQLDVAQVLRPEWETDGLKINHKKCVHCGRCIRVCETTGNYLLGFVSRGPSAYIGYGGDSDTAQGLCEQCHACVFACPAGALAW